MDFYGLTPDQQVENLRHVAINALPLWGLPEDSKVEPIKYRENSVYKVTTEQHGSFALRVHRSGYHSDNALNSELLWMNALREKGICTPKVISSTRGAYVETVTVDQVPEPRQVDLLEWVNCTPLGTIEEGVDEGSMELYKVAGQLMAKLHNETQEWDIPQGFERQHWDTKGMLSEQALWGCGWEHDDLTDEQRDLIVKARDKAGEVLSSIPKGAGSYGLIHCDFLPENLLVDEQGNIHLIDFDDSGFGYHMFDIATTLFWFLGEDSFDKITDEFLHGYLEEREISEEQIALLPWFLFIRGLVYLGWGHTRKETETAIEMAPLVIGAVTQLATQLLED
ncbi:phosphotransferase enzyme family protein [Vibrio tapetis]|uniref:Aminoglycoside phosphotransferase n=1 Tax=Vibrio tapetis subsp. tapetis TaxID=1671868 RepID=A0A2N8ZCQ7_9VIBR|nr:phosphotransferase [Vibrio tapetis]SON49688.1 Aminoglycoside phosphotransferase [Vibrio tapetis subsp. tapetis]